MQIGKQFNTFSPDEYFFYIDNYKKYKDFNTLGLYRSIVENEKLTLTDQISVREYAHKTFKKSFDFLQLKDPLTFIKVEYLGQELTKGDEEKVWKQIQKNQQLILKDKRIKHRNFGIYSKHTCYSDCIWNGVMIRQGSWLTEYAMNFDSDQNKCNQRIKSDNRKSDRKKERQIINRELEVG